MKEYRLSRTAARRSIRRVHGPGVGYVVLWLGGAVGFACIAAFVFVGYFLMGA